jgi:C_GCAxxG_C_C family probable redox protein
LNFEERKTLMALTRRDILQVAGGLAVGAVGALATAHCVNRECGAKQNDSPPQPKAFNNPPPVGKAEFPITRNAEDAEAMFKQGFNCAQAVLTCCGRSFGLPEETGKRMGSAFVGGMGMMGLTCGSVSGAFMAIGLKHAQTDAANNAPAGEANRLVREFARRFKKLHGSICCNELLGLDISTPEGLQKAVAEEYFTKTRCPIYVRDAAALLEHLLKEESQKTASRQVDAKEVKP